MYISISGIYKDEYYSCIFHESERYTKISKNGLYFYKIGVVDGSSSGPAILVFDITDDSFIYGKRVKAENTLEEDICYIENRKKFLTERHAKMPSPAATTYSIKKIAS